MTASRARSTQRGDRIAKDGELEARRAADHGPSISTRLAEPLSKESGC
jgi:hypothetical protein